MSIASFKALLRKRDKTLGKGADWQFLKWYAEDIRLEKDDSHYNITDGTGDGGIDLIIRKADSLEIVQSKLGALSSREVDWFRQAMEGWQSKSKFVRWLDEKVKSSEAREVYAECFEKFSRSDISWRIITAQPVDLRMVRPLRSLAESIGRYSFDVFDQDDVLFYHGADHAGVRHIDALRIVPVAGGEAWKHSDTRSGQSLTTYFAVFRIADLVEAIKKEDDVEAFFSRNVRVRVQNSDVNPEITSTYTMDSPNFFYGNGGIHILSTGVVTDPDGALEIRRPQIINGGQTIRALIDAKTHNDDGLIFARITRIPRLEQLESTNDRFLENVIFRSNSNNRMEASDLRSNDRIQLDIARELLDRGIFYERKLHQWSATKHKPTNVGGRINSRRLAQITFLCEKGWGSGKWGPAVLRDEVGVDRLFRRVRRIAEEVDEDGARQRKSKRLVPMSDDLYKAVFRIVTSDWDRTESKIRLDALVNKAVSKTPGLGALSEYRGSSKDYVLGIVWEIVRGKRGLHPLRFPIGKGKQEGHTKKFSREVMALTRDLIKLFRHDLETEPVFRDNRYWNKAKQRLLSQARRSRFIDICEDFNESQDE